MIYGIGVDLCQVSRISRAMNSLHFIERTFVPEERAYAESGQSPAKHYAAAFAAKEAFAKAGGWGLAKVGLKSVWVSREQGAPRLHLTEKAKQLLPANAGFRIHLSLSHENDMAIAVVILEVWDDPLL